MRLIDADKLLDDISAEQMALAKFQRNYPSDRLVEGQMVELQFVKGRVESMPTIDVEQKHGHWIKPTGMMPPEHHGHYECSACHQWAMRNWKHRLELTDYCPHCGAKMDGKEDE